MYAYCVAMIVSSDPVIARRAVMRLALLMVVQQVLIVAFGSQVYFSSIVSHEHPNKEQALVACYYRNPTDHHDLFIFDDKVIHGEPIGILAAGLVGVFLVAANVKVEDRELFEASCSVFTGIWWKTSLLILAWAMQAIYLAGFFVNAVPVLLALGNDSMDLIFSTLATTFIIEVDDFLYDNFLEKEERRDYELAKRKLHFTQQECRFWSSCFFKINVVWMAVLFLFYRLVLNSLVGAEYSELFILAGHLGIAMFAIRCVVWFSALRHGSWSWFSVCEMLLYVPCFSVLCYLHFVYVANNLFGPYIPLAGQVDLSHCIK